MPAASTKTNSSASVPSGKRPRKARGSRVHRKPASSTRSGSRTRARARAGTARSIRGASQRPARKPSTTLGSEAMISIMRLEVALVTGVHELGGVHGPQDAQRDRQQQRVEGPLEGAGEQGRQGELGLEVVRAARGLPDVFGLLVPLVPDLAEERPPGGLRVGVVDGDLRHLRPLSTGPRQVGAVPLGRIRERGSAGHRRGSGPQGTVVGREVEAQPVAAGRQEALVARRRGDQPHGAGKAGKLVDACQASRFRPAAGRGSRRRARRSPAPPPASGRPAAGGAR